MRTGKSLSVIYLTEYGEIRTTLPFFHTASVRPVFLWFSTTCRTAFFIAASAISCKDILFFISHLKNLCTILNNSGSITSLCPFFVFAINTGFSFELSNILHASRYRFSNSLASYKLYRSIKITKDYYTSMKTMRPAAATSIKARFQYLFLLPAPAPQYPSSVL